MGRDHAAARWRQSLHWRLIMSHGAVILLALGLVLIISAVYLRRYERTAEANRLAQLAVPLVAEVNVLSLANRIDADAGVPISVLDAQADAMDVRLIMVDPDGLIRYDTGESANLRRTQLTDHLDSIAGVFERAQNSRGIAYEIIEPAAGEQFARERVLVAAGQTGQVRPRRVLLIVSEARRYPLLGRFLPRMALVAGISLIAAAAVGLALSRWIARPIERLTIAADAMAAGTLEQAVPGEGPDDIGRLVHSFNTMSARVAAIDRAQRELLANVAHELRTPLTSVQGYARAIRDGVVPEAGTTDALRLIERQAERMGTLIGQLLDLARLESGQLRIAQEPVRVSDLFGDAVANFAPAAAERGIVLTAADAGELTILGDAGRLAQVITNLVSNALRHTASSGLITLDAEVGPPLAWSARTVRLTIADNGEGISEDRLPAIFNRFERGARAGSDGFGLGLAIVHELVDRHGGRIEVASRLGEGTTFRIDLPAA